MFPRWCDAPSPGAYRPQIWDQLMEMVCPPRGGASVPPTLEAQNTLVSIINPPVLNLHCGRKDDVLMNK